MLLAVTTTASISATSSTGRNPDDLRHAYRRFAKKHRIVKSLVTDGPNREQVAARAVFSEPVIAGHIGYHAFRVAGRIRQLLENDRGEGDRFVFSVVILPFRTICAWSGVARLVTMIRRRTGISRGCLIVAEFEKNIERRRAESYNPQSGSEISGTLIVRFNTKFRALS